MPLASRPRGGKRFGAGRRLLSPASFTKSSENRGETKHKWSQEHNRIYIRKEIHETWKRMKGLCLYSTDSAFAQHLLSLEMRRRARMTVSNLRPEKSHVHYGDREVGTQLGTGGDNSVYTSTPLKRTATTIADVPIKQSPIAIQEASFDVDVNITGSTFHLNESSGEDSDIVDESNPLSDGSDTDTDDDPDFNATILSDALKELDEDRDYVTSSSSEVEEDFLHSEVADTENDALVENPEFELSGYLEDASEDDVGDKSDSTNHEEMTRKTITGEQIDTGLMHIPFVKEPAGEPNKFSRWEESPGYKSELKLVQSMKVICALDLLVQLFAQKCRAAQCQLPCIVDFTLCGTSVLIKWKCADGHSGKFCSSHRGDDDSLLSNNLQASAAILFSETMFKDVFHSLDIWHKAKSIKKCISKVGSTKGMEKIKKWSEHIIRHFWYCCSTVSQIEPQNDEVALGQMKEMWISVLHHVCDQHEWLCGKCSHGELPSEERELPWFDRRDKDFEALQAIILEPSLLDSFKHYTRFRHTGALERANSMSLMYASKRHSFSKKGLTARKQLAAIDWNYHLETKTASNAYGETSVSRKYNQRTKTWNVRVLKDSKDYQYIWMLMAKVFRLRSDDEGGIQRAIAMDTDDPRRIAPTIAEAPPVPSIELYERHRSRFPQGNEH
ncbi:uncharacterized protein LOC114950456 isoform X4 [Acropora millepora]|uniref:uncharacterized protein LOC114950456 isoform X4 n=1 Tax=Acropora millepora TaxID=45264 RepID=UPI001CF39358|nr:uncharacterized protein LOC114950456 isoform X4 [Acropora millepora]